MENLDLFLKKQKSQIDGFGIFTEKPIKKGDVFYEIPTDKISNVPIERFARIGDGQYVDDEAVLNWINHYCDANTKLELNEQPRLIALRDIGVNEEISCDYNETEIGGTKALCKCGHEKCKGFFSSVS